MNEIVRDWMTVNVISVAPSASLAEAHEIMESKGIRCLAVMENSELTGILSQGDVRAAKASAAHSELTLSIDAIMTPNPITISETVTVAFAAKIMLQLKVSGLPAVEENGT